MGDGSEPLDLGPIRAREAAATAGPWEHSVFYLTAIVYESLLHPSRNPFGLLNGTCVYCSFDLVRTWRDGMGRTFHVHRDSRGGDWHDITSANGESITGNYDEESGGVCSTEADADFIAHARADVPALLAEVERLQALLAEAQAWLSGARSDEFPTRRTQRDLLCARIEAALPKDERV